MPTLDEVRSGNERLLVAVEPKIPRPPRAPLITQPLAQSVSLENGDGYLLSLGKLMDPHPPAPSW